MFAKRGAVMEPTVARSKNLRLGVTGALLFSRGQFAQVLEGSLESVETVFEAIQLDARHRDLNVLFFQPIEKRDFGDWSMAFAGLLDEEVLPINVPGVYANQDSTAVDHRQYFESSDQSTRAGRGVLRKRCLSVWGEFPFRVQAV